MRDWGRGVGSWCVGGGIGGLDRLDASGGLRRGERVGSKGPPRESLEGARKGARRGRRGRVGMRVGSISGRGRVDFSVGPTLILPNLEIMLSGPLYWFLCILWAGARGQLTVLILDESSRMLFASPAFLLGAF